MRGSYGSGGSEDASPRGAQPDDAALIQAAKQDLAAFGPLYARYVDRVYTYLRMRTGPGRSDDAADLTQQVFLRALDALPRYQSRAGASFAAWLLGIARNAATDWQRRQRRTVPWEAVPEDLHPPAAETPDGVVLSRDEIAELNRLLGTLSEEAREVLVLRFTGQLSLAEIGAVIGTSEDAARKRVARALQLLKERYHDDTP